MDEIDLDRLARGYRHRPTGNAARERARREAADAGLCVGAIALDIGGGRGEHATEFAATGALAVVIDRSPEMAGAARTRVAALVGAAESLPVADRSVDLVYFHVSIHYGNWRLMLSEAARVLRPGGRLAVWSFSSEHLRQSFLGRWFPSVARIDAARFPEISEIAARLDDLGCIDVTIDGETEVVERTVGTWRRAVEAGFVSTLQLLPPGELEAGLERFDALHPDSHEILRYQLDYRRVAGRVPGLPLP